MFPISLIPVLVAFVSLWWIPSLDRFPEPGITEIAPFELSVSEVQPSELRVAVASNFTPAMRVISERFERATGTSMIVIPGSSGKHVAQIINGAPYDLFFSADTDRPARLEERGVAIPETRFTYAIGRLVLWSPQPELVDTSALILDRNDWSYLAIANPKLAPYGKAAQEVLEGRGLWHSIQKRIVRGENIGQTMHFVQSGNAEMGFVAYSQVAHTGNFVSGSMWVVPENLYTPIDQQGVLLRDTEPGRAFMTFMKSQDVLAIIHDFGYLTR